MVAGQAGSVAVLVHTLGEALLNLGIVRLAVVILLLLFPVAEASNRDEDDSDGDGQAENEAKVVVVAALGGRGSAYSGGDVARVSVAVCEAAASVTQAHAANGRWVRARNAVGASAASRLTVAGGAVGRLGGGCAGRAADALCAEAIVARAAIGDGLALHALPVVREVILPVGAVEVGGSSFLAGCQSGTVGVGCAGCAFVAAAVVAVAHRGVVGTSACNRAFTSCGFGRRSNIGSGQAFSRPSGHHAAVRVRVTLFAGAIGAQSAVAISVV